MAEANLVRIIRWLRREEKHPEYVLLPHDEYVKKWKAWDLPAPPAPAAGT